MVSNANRHLHRPNDPALRYLRLLLRAAAFVDAHLDSPLDATTLAAEAAMSRHHFHRLFHAHFGLTVGGYLTWRRLRQACAQLQETTAPVLDIALAAGFDSAQALAKAMKRELGLTPTLARAGHPVPWSDWLARQRIPEMPLSPSDGRSMLRPQWRTVPDLLALTARGWGMTDGNMTAAVRQGFSELIPALEAAHLMPRVTRSLSLLTDAPQGPNDPTCQMMTGALFGYDPHNGVGAPQRPAIALRGSLAWLRLTSTLTIRASRRPNACAPHCICRSNEAFPSLLITRSTCHEHTH